MKQTTDFLRTTSKVLFTAFILETVVLIFMLVFIFSMGLGLVNKQSPSSGYFSFSTRLSLIMPSESFQYKSDFDDRRFFYNNFSERKLIPEQFSLRKENSYILKVKAINSENLILFFVLGIYSLVYIMIFPYITWQLKLLMDSFVVNGFFHEDHYKRLRKIGIIILFIAIMRVFMAIWESFEVKKILAANHLFSPSSEIKLDALYNSVLLIGFGLTILVIAQAFRFGENLKEENDLTI